MTAKPDSKNSTRSRDLDASLATVPECVRNEVSKYRRSREPGRALLVDELHRHCCERLDAYDAETKQYLSTLLQVYEMSLQSKPIQRGRSGDCDIERER